MHDRDNTLAQQAAVINARRMQKKDLQKFTKREFFIYSCQRDL